MTSDANYEMKNPDEDFDDTKILATDVVMLRIMDKTTGEIINDVTNSNSNFNVRPLKIEFTKETESKIQLDYEDLKEQVDNIKYCEVTSNGKNIKFFMDVHLTMFDGKSLTSITKLYLKKHHEKNEDSYNISQLFAEEEDMSDELVIDEDFMDEEDEFFFQDETFTESQRESVYLL